MLSIILPDKKIRKRFRNENKQTARVLSPNHLPVDATSNLFFHAHPTNSPLPRLIEQDYHIINIAHYEDQLKTVLQDSDEILEHRHLTKGPNASM